MKPSIASRTSLFVGSLLISLLVAEVGIRRYGSYDRDGNFRFLGRDLRPYHLPIARTGKNVDDYFSSPSTTVIYDPELGWSPRPNANSRNGFYRYNSAGIRSAPSEYSPSPTKDRLRIAIFGDSFTHGDDVPFADTWGHRLEGELKKADVDAEIINFGVGGYGLDQAYLRWRKVGHRYDPQIVVLGFQPEMVERSLNLLRPVYFRRSGLPFSKPRFVLAGDDLKLINVPTLPPDRIVDVMERIESWDLVRYESFYRPEDYRSSIAFRSKLLSFTADTISRSGAQRSTEGEAFKLGLRIIQEFKKEVEDKGGTFLIVYLPRRGDLSLYAQRNGRKLSDPQLLRAIENQIAVIHPEHEMVKEVKASSLSAVVGDHYTANGNRIVAAVIAEFITERVLRNGR